MRRPPDPRSIVLRGRLQFGAALAGVTLVLVLTLWPGAPSPSIPEVANVDKLFHAAAWGMLAIVTFVPFFRRRALVCWGALVAFGALIEVVQKFLPPRSADAWDAVADAVGAALGVAVMLAWERRRARIRAGRLATHGSPREAVAPREPMG